MVFLPVEINSAIRAAVSNSVVHNRVYAGGIPTFTTLKRVNGAVLPYIICRWYLPDLYGAKGFDGARGDTWRMRFDVLSIAADEDSAYVQGLKVLKELAGFFPVGGCSQVTVSPGSATYTVQNSNDDPAAYVAPMQFFVTFGPLDTESI